MATELYFDTARLGRMCTEARAAEQDFLKLASQLGSSLYWEKFLIEGNEALPASLRSRCTALSCWNGLAGLQQGLADFLALPPDGSVLLAGQSRTLIALAAESLFERCSCVLATDLEWPPYLAVLKLSALQHGKPLRVMPVRQQVLIAKCNRRELISQLVSEYFHHGCDGLFLSDITHTGVRIPYQTVLQRISNVEHPRFVVIDGAQALGQRSVKLSGIDVDLYLAGTQKWFGAYHPLRLAFVAPRAAWVVAALRRLLATRQLFDPLTEFCQSIAMGNWRVFGETVNLSALMTAAEALSGWTRSPGTITARWNRRRMNRRLVLNALTPTVCPTVDESLASGIVLLRFNGSSHSTLPSCTSLREALGHEHVVVSEPLRGMVRLAMPGVRLSATVLSRLHHALKRIAVSTDHSFSVARPHSFRN